MPTKKQILEEADRRRFAKYIFDARSERASEAYFSDWHEGIRDFDRMYDGDWSFVWPDGIAEQSKPIVVNIPQIAADDISRLAAEVVPQIRCEPESNDQDDVKKAYKRQAIAYTYHDVNDGEEKIPEYAYDLGSAGVALEAASMNEGDEYPTITRIDPRGAFPRFVNGKLVDLIVVQTFEKALIGPGFDLDLTHYFDAQTLGTCTEVEVVDYYNHESVSRVLIAKSGTGSNANTLKGSDIVQTWMHGLGRVPVAWGRMKTANGKLGGLFDQISGIALSMNRIMNLELAYAEQAVYAPFFSFDVENDEDPPGPKTVYRGRTPEAKMTRVAPATSNPQTFALLEILERFGRSGANYPAQRQGEVSQSIASASFVSSTLGQLTTLVKTVQKQIAHLWEIRNELCFALDRKYGGDAEKALTVSSGKFGAYVPSRDIGEYMKTKVVYGAGAGLDALNKKQAITQDMAGGITSKETAREQTDYILDPEGEAQKIARETVETALVQRILTDPNVGADLLMRFLMLLDKGMSLRDAAGELAAMEEQDRMMRQLEAQKAATGAGGMSGMAPGAAPEGVPGAPSPQGPPPGGLGAGGEAQLPLPPLEQVLVRAPSGG